MARKSMSVEAAVERDLEELRKRDRALGESALAASALALARELDDPDNSATSKSMCAKALVETMGDLRGRAPAAKNRDRVDELSHRRTRRIARRAAS